MPVSTCRMAAGASLRPAAKPSQASSRPRSLITGISRLWANRASAPPGQPLSTAISEPGSAARSASASSTCATKKILQPAAAKARATGIAPRP